MTREGISFTCVNAVTSEVTYALLESMCMAREAKRSFFNLVTNVVQKLHHYALATTLDKNIHTSKSNCGGYLLIQRT